MKQVRAFIIGLVCAMVLMPLSARAHTASTYYSGSAGGTWPASTNHSYWAWTNFPSSAHRSRIVDGAKAWNDASTGVEPNFVYQGTRSSGGNALYPCSASYSIAYWYDLDAYLGTSFVGYTPRCENTSGRVFRFSLVMDSDTSWYTGTGTPGSTQTDLWSFTTHEWGHATGWGGHYPASDVALCADIHARTMCRDGFRGTVRFRTLEDHDIHTFLAAY